MAYFAFSPKYNTATAGEREDDLVAIDDSAINFQLFEYSNKINRPAADAEGWRKITQYFQFRGQDNQRLDLYDGEGMHLNRDIRYEDDGFTVNHATVERTLTGNYPVFDPNRNALGHTKSPKVTEADLPLSDRNLGYLFSAGDHAVTAYNPTDTILQKDGTHYFYNSAKNAVDYDEVNNMFRVRNYVERNGTTSTWGAPRQYYDFLPFNYTGGHRHHQLCYGSD